MLIFTATPLAYVPITPQLIHIAHSPDVKQGNALPQTKESIIDLGDKHNSSGVYQAEKLEDQRILQTSPAFSCHSLLTQELGDYNTGRCSEIQPQRISIQFSPPSLTVKIPSLNRYQVNDILAETCFGISLSCAYLNTIEHFFSYALDENMH